jgi:hypothetical protein
MGHTYIAMMLKVVDQERNVPYQLLRVAEIVEALGAFFAAAERFV